MGPAAGKAAETGLVEPIIPEGRSLNPHSHNVDDSINSDNIAKIHVFREHSTKSVSAVREGLGRSAVEGVLVRMRDTCRVSSSNSIIALQRVFRYCSQLSHKNGPISCPTRNATGKHVDGWRMV